MAKPITKYLAALLDLHHQMRGSGSTTALVQAANANQGILVVVNQQHAAQYDATDIKPPGRAMSFISLTQYASQFQGRPTQPLLVDNAVIMLIAEDALNTINSLENEVEYLKTLTTLL